MYSIMASSCSSVRSLIALLVFAGHQQSEDLGIRGRLRPTHPATAFCPCCRKSRKSAQMTSSLSLLREPRSRPAGCVHLFLL
jgi:hypothetical protein